jgi:hypothetical protein
VGRPVQSCQPFRSAKQWPVTDRESALGWQSGNIKGKPMALRMPLGILSS